MLKLYIASDHAGFEVKKALIQHFSNVFSVIDLGCNSPERTSYVEPTQELAQKIQNEQDAFGILICGSGIGVSITANRYKNVRSAVIYNEKIAELSRQHNNANVACFGARFFSINEIIQMAEIFLSTNFSGGIYAERVSSIDL